MKIVQSLQDRADRYELRNTRQIYSVSMALPCQRAQGLHHARGRADLKPL